MSGFPSLKARQLLRVLMREPLGYRVVRQTGSHRRLEAPGRPPITWGHHDRRSLAPSEVRKILTRDARLGEAEARRLLSGR